MDGPMPGMATREEIDRLGTLPPEKADELFLRLMIPHHEAAIPMARAIKGRSGEPVVDRFAGKVVASQKAEVDNMQKMLEDMGARRWRTSRPWTAWTWERTSTTVGDPRLEPRPLRGCLLGIGEASLVLPSVPRSPRVRSRWPTCRRP